ncbi:MAG: hypothetical protein RIM99_11130 [Cyclobacteriaceae bacterium]
MYRVLIFSLSLFLNLATSGQAKLMVTDFVFFNNFDSPHAPGISDFFKNDSSGLKNVKEQVTEILTRKYSLDEVVFHDKSLWFVGYQDPSIVKQSDWYQDNHRKVVKEGGYDYYLRFYADISSANISTETTEYVFSLQVRISDSRGKKVFRNIARIPFQSLFYEDKISGSGLLSSKEFYQFFEDGVSVVFNNEKSQFDSRTIFREESVQLKDFTHRARYMKLEKYKSNHPILSGEGMEELELTIRNGFEDEDKGSGILSSNLELQTIIRIKNPKLEDDWKAWVTSESTKTLRIFETSSATATIKIKPENKDLLNFELKNNQLSGEIEGNKYSLIFETESQLMLVYVDQKLSALIQQAGNERSPDLKMFYEGANETLAIILNLHQLYLKAIYTLDEVRRRN